MLVIQWKMLVGIYLFPANSFPEPLHSNPSPVVNAYSNSVSIFVIHLPIHSLVGTIVIPTVQKKKPKTQKSKQKWVAHKPKEGMSREQDRHGAWSALPWYLIYREGEQISDMLKWLVQNYMARCSSVPLPSKLWIESLWWAQWLSWIQEILQMHRRWPLV